jgi:glycogen synthase
MPGLADTVQAFHPITRDASGLVFQPLAAEPAVLSAESVRDSS